LDQRYSKRRRATTKYVRGRGVGGSGRLGRREKAALLGDPVTQLLELLFRKNVLVVLGEKLQLLIHKRRAFSLMSIEYLDLTRTRAMVKRAILRWMHPLSDSPLTLAGLWRRQK